MTGWTSTYLVDSWLGWVFGGASWTPPSAVYAQFHVGDPGASGTANQSATNTRVAATFGSASAGAIAMTNTPQVTLVSSETISWISLWDNPTVGSGNFLGSVQAATAQSGDSGDIIQFTSDSMSLSVFPAAWPSAYLANALLNATFNGTAWTPPSGIFAQFHTNSPGTSGTSNQSATNTRVAATFGAASAGTIAMSNQPQVTAVSTETLAWISYWDNVTVGSGNFLGAVQPTPSKSVISGNVVVLSGQTLSMPTAA